MKRFGIALRVGSDPPPKLGSSYSDSVRRRYLGIFRPRAQRYRRRRFIAIALMLGFILACAVLAETRAGSFLGIWGGVLLLACWLGAALLLLFGLRLRCPACRKRLMPATGAYCPQCGSDQYDHGRHLRGPAQSRWVYCPSCDGTIYDGDNELPRTYRLRGCTHCGVMLDERGL